MFCCTAGVLQRTRLHAECYERAYLDCLAWGKAAVGGGNTNWKLLNNLMHTHTHTYFRFMQMNLCGKKKQILFCIESIAWISIFFLLISLLLCICNESTISGDHHIIPYLAWQMRVQYFNKRHISHPQRIRFQTFTSQSGHKMIPISRPNRHA